MGIATVHLHICVVLSWWRELDNCPFKSPIPSHLLPTWEDGAYTVWWWWRPGSDTAHSNAGFPCLSSVFDWLLLPPFLCILQTINNWKPPCVYLVLRHILCTWHNLPGLPLQFLCMPQLIKSWRQEGLGMRLHSLKRCRCVAIGMLNCCQCCYLGSTKLILRDRLREQKNALVSSILL